VRKLEALEEDRYDLLPDAVFVRALASSVCRTLKVDAQPILDRLPQGAAPRLVPDDDGINAPFRAPGDAPGQTWISQVSRPVVLTVAALLIGAVVLIFLPARHADQPVADAGKSADPVMPPASAMVNPAPMEPAPAPAPAAAAAEPAASMPAPAPVAVAASAPVAAAAARPASAASAPAVAASAARTATVTAAAPASAASAPSTPASGIITFRAKGQSWVKVTDAKGTTVFQKLMNAGETAGATGTLPLSVTVGSAGTTEVEVRGQPFDLAPLSRDNVARFEVK